MGVRASGVRLIVGVALSLVLAATLSDVNGVSAAAGSDGRLLGVTGCCPNQLVTADSSTGQLTTIGTVGTASGFLEGGLSALDPATHTLFLELVTFNFPSPPQFQIVSINTQTASESISPGFATSLAFMAFDTSSSTLVGVTVCCPTQLVKVNPSTGQLTTIGTVGTASGFLESLLSALDPATHTLFLELVTFNFPSPPQFQIVSINTQTASESISPALGTSFAFLGFDTSSSTLVGVTGCCPNQLVTVNPSTGQLATIGTVSTASGFLNSGLSALDPATHTLFLELATFAFPSPPLFQIVSVNTQTASDTISPALASPLAFLAFEPTLITPQSIEADVATLQSNGGITNDGIADSLLAMLVAAANARAGSNCTAAANIYGAFINELAALAGKAISSSGAATLTSEAKFLIAHCP